jgi:hypothetical protein
MTNWGAAAGASHTQKITGDGEYELSLANTSGDTVTGLTVFTVDFTDLAKSDKWDATGMSVSDIVVKIDGKEVPADTSKMVFGRIEKDSTALRLEISNPGGEGLTGEDSPFDVDDPDAIDFESVEIAESISVSFTISGLKKGTTDLGDQKIQGYVGDGTIADLNPVEEGESYATLVFADDSWWKMSNWGPVVGASHTRKVTGDGEYELSLTNNSGETVTGLTVFTVDFTNLAKSDKWDATEMKVSDIVVKIDGKEVPADTSKMVFGRIESESTALRLEISNPGGEGLTGEDSPFDVNDPDAIDFESVEIAESISVSFKVSGLKEGTTDLGTEKIQGYAGQTIKDIQGTQESENPEASASAPAASASAPAVTVTSAPAVSTSPAAVTTGDAVTGTSKLTVAKSLVVVAPNKSTTVKYTAKKAAGASSAAVVKVSSKSKKVAKVTKKGTNKIKITVPKKAVKGASTTVTLKSTKLNGKAVSATVKVYVRNTAKKVKAAKKSISVKKGKTVKLVLNASGKIQNKKKPVAETVTVQGKVVKLTAVKYAKKKITVTLKGVKKAKNKAVTIKVGTKKVKVKATVK